MEIKLLPASEVPFSDLIECVNRSYEDYFVRVHMNREGLKNLLERESVRADISPVAMADGRIVGTVFLGQRGDAGWIGGVGVMPEYRRQGIARQLLGHAIEEAIDAKIRTLQLEVIYENESAILLYQSAGFTLTRDLFVMSRDTGKTDGIQVEGKSIQRFRGGKRSESLNWLSENTGVRLSWQREPDALRTERSSLRGIALLDDNSRSVEGLCLYQEVKAEVDIKAFTAPDGDTGEMLMGELIKRYRWSYISSLNVPEDDPMLPVYKNFGFKIVLIQREMILPIG